MTYVLAVLSEEHVHVRDACYYKIILVVRSVNILQVEIFFPASRGVDLPQLELRPEVVGNPN